MTESIATMVHVLAMALLHFLWQGALVGLLAWLTLALLRNARPQARYAVACGALLACALLPAWNLVVATGDPASTTTFAAVAPPADATDAPLRLRATAFVASIASWPAPSHALLAWVVAAWAFGAALLSLRMAGGAWWVRRLCRGAAPHAGTWQACVDRLAPRLGISRPVAVRMVDAGDGPMTAGWWKPVVLLPAAIVARVPADLVEALVAHELAHVRRHDYLVNLLQGAVEALLFYHPVVWWLSHRIRIERELVADDLAAAALGEPRRLAIALSELDRATSPRSPFPHAHFAQAAHGGHLMSRIQQLVRPGRRAIGGALVLPLLGIAAAGAAFYAHARLADAPLPASAPVVVAETVVARPAAAVATVVESAVEVATDAAGARTWRMGDDGPSYALVRKGQGGFTMSGHMDDVDGVRDAQHAIDGDFIWFRRDGKSWVVRDADTVARARAAWQPAEGLESQMQALNARMKPHNDRLEALGKRMEALGSVDGSETPEMTAASERMHALGKRMEALAGRQAALAGQQIGADDAQHRELDRQMQELQAQQQALDDEMQRHAAAMEAVARRIEAQHAPMEAVAREMEAASKPMEAIGKEMEALGVRIERQAAMSDAEVRKVIDDAWRRGLAEPAPTRQ